MHSYSPPLLPLPPDCFQATFLRRVKRFSVEAQFRGEKIWAHCNNSGAMLGLLRAGAPILLSPAGGRRRKLQYTLERVWLGNAENGFWCGVNTMLPNRILESAFYAGLLPFAVAYETFHREVKFGSSRLDACLSALKMPRLWVECKNVTLVEDDVAAFPDAQSARARKHLEELIDLVRCGNRAAMFYLVQRPDGKCFAPADYIDAAYADQFYAALAKGVEAYAFHAIQDNDGVRLGEQLKIRQ